MFKNYIRNEFLNISYVYETYLSANFSNLKRTLKKYNQTVSKILSDIRAAGIVVSRYIITVILSTLLLYVKDYRG